VKQDILSALDDLDTRVARAGLYEALVTGGVLAQRNLGSLGDNELKNKPDALFETEQFKRAYQRLLDNLDAQLRNCRLKDRVLLALFVIGFLSTIAFIAWAFRTGHPAKDARTWLSAIPTTAVGLWNRSNAKMMQRLHHDLLILGKAEQKQTSGKMSIRKSAH
jgi:hypothetical protein